MVSAEDSALIRQKCKVFYIRGKKREKVFSEICKNGLQSFLKPV